MILHTYDLERERHWHIAPLNTNMEHDHQLLQEPGFQLSRTVYSAMNSTALHVTSSEHTTFGGLWHFQHNKVCK
jgi:hypothetical protein